MKRILSILFLIVLTISVLAGCAERKKYYAGENISPSSIARYSEKIFESESVPKTEAQDKEPHKTETFSDTDETLLEEQTEETNEPSIEATTNTTESVSEKTPDVTFESTVLSETVTDNTDIPNTLEIETKEIESKSDIIVNTNIYYWTPGGEKYHIFRDCSTLSRSKTILSGTLEEGKAAGKSGLCKTCEKRR